MKRDRSLFLGVMATASALSVTVAAPLAAEWPRLPSEPTGEATVWDPGPRWPTLPSERRQERLSRSDAEPGRAQPPRSAADVTGSIRPPTLAPSFDAAVGEPGPQWPNVPSAQRDAEATPEPTTWPITRPTAAAAARGRAQPSPSPPAGDTTGTIGGAQWPAIAVPSPISPFAFEVGGRYWYSFGSTRFGFTNGHPLAGDPTSTLDWNDTTGHSGEVFARVDHRPTGLFVKGLIGGGALDGGTIIDRDFVVGQIKFSDTTSVIDGKNLAYGIVDAGWSWDVPAIGFRIGGFAGYHYWRQKMTASGLVLNADDLGGWYYGYRPPGTKLVPDSTAVFVYEPTWHALRLGVDARWQFLPCWSVQGEVAWVPIAHLENKDSHLLRQSYADLGPAPNIISKSSSGYGVEAEVFVNYGVTPNIELGIGGRVWALDVDGGTVAFGPGFGTSYELTRFEQLRYGLLVQAKGRF